MAEAMTSERFRALVELAGGAEAMRAADAAHEANLDYLDREHGDLTRQYPDRWVGILQCRVQAVGDSAEEVVEALRRDAKFVDGVVLHFMRTDQSIQLI